MQHRRRSRREGNCESRKLPAISINSMTTHARGIPIIVDIRFEIVVTFTERPNGIFGRVCKYHDSIIIIGIRVMNIPGQTRESIGRPASANAAVGHAKMMNVRDSINRRTFILTSDTNAL